MRRSYSITLVILLTSVSCMTATNKTTREATLWGLAEPRGLSVGAAVHARGIRQYPQYGATLAREFNMLTTENALKFGPVHPAYDRYRFENADVIVEFAEKHDMQVRGHCLVWHRMNPKWLTETDWDRDELSRVLREHIQTVVGRYKGRIAVWDVVNEAVGGNGSMRETLWLEHLGADYVADAFRWAHEIDPDAQLFYNDFGGEGLGKKSDAIYEYVRGLLNQGVPVHGVGLQMHVSTEHSPPPGDVAANIRRLAALGLQVHITELDVAIEGDVSEQELADQADIYRDLMGVCVREKGCTALVTWGFTDAHSWIPGFRPGWGAALPFDEQYRPKPAYLGMIQALKADGRE